MANISPTSKIRILVAFHSLSLCAIAYATAYDWPYFDRYTYWPNWSMAGLFTAQVSLLAAWAAIGKSPAYLRITALGAATVMLSYIYPGISDFNIACGWWWVPYTGRYDLALDYDHPIERNISWFVAIAGLAVSVAVPMTVIRSFGIRLGKRRRSAWQFSLAELLGWTAAVAILAAICGMLTRIGWQLDAIAGIWLHHGTFGPITFGLIAVVMVVLVLGPFRRRWQVAVACCIVLCGSYFDRYSISASVVGEAENPYLWRFYAAMHMTYGLVLFGSLLWMSSCGYRLNWYPPYVRRKDHG